MVKKKESIFDKPSALSLLFLGFALFLAFSCYGFIIFAHELGPNAIGTKEQLDSKQRVVDITISRGIGFEWPDGVKIYVDGDCVVSRVR